MKARLVETSLRGWVVLFDGRCPCFARIICETFPGAESVSRALSSVSPTVSRLASFQAADLMPLPASGGVITWGRMEPTAPHPDAIDTDSGSTASDEFVQYP